MITAFLMVQSDLKRKTVNGFFWGLIESFFSQGLGIAFGIILARLLSVEEFGLLGMITIIISISQVLVDSGLNQSLIRKSNCSEEDYSTVFWMNLAVGLFLYLVLWFCSPLIASFYNEPSLEAITRVSGLAVIIGALTLIQQTKITKEIDFKILTVISSAGTFISGVVSIIMAYNGYGVWSLVWRMIINQAVRSILLWMHNKWYPTKSFSWTSFKDLFGFGSNILFVSLIATLFKHIYNVLIGKNYSKAILGYYTTADNYSAMASNTISSVTGKVSYPILVNLQNDDAKLKASCSKLIHTIMFSSFLGMFGLVAIAKPLLVVLLGDKWLPSVIFFQVLCIAYSISPMQMINQNILKVKGRSDLFFRTEILKYIFFVPIIILGIFFGLHVLIAGIAVYYWISFLLNAMYSGKLIQYSALQQFREIVPLIAIFAFSTLVTLTFGYFVTWHKIFMLIAQCVIYAGTSIGITLLLKLPAYFDIKEVILRKLGYITVFNFLKK